MRLGSWRDPEVARDVKVVAAIGGLVFFALALPEGFEGLAPILGLLAALAAVAAVLMHLRGGPEASPVDANSQTPHRGPNMSRIALGGFPGLIFAAGFVWMFWLGLPAFRPIVIALGVFGLLGGAILVRIGRRHRAISSNPLGLHGDAHSGQSRPDR